MYQVLKFNIQGQKPQLPILLLLSLVKKSRLKYDLLGALPKLSNGAFLTPLEFSVYWLRCISDTQTTAKPVCLDFNKVGGQRHLL